MLGEMRPAAVGIVVNDHVAGAEILFADFGDEPLDHESDRANLRRTEFRLRQHVPLAVEKNA